MTITLDLVKIARLIEFFGCLSSIYLVVWLTWLNGRAYREMTRTAIKEAVAELKREQAITPE
jgi:hypothetical protein